MLCPKPPSENRRPIVLLPHQKRLQRHLPAMRFPFFVYWGMGSGKTIAGCVCMQLLEDGQSALVLCDKTTVEQWKVEVGRLLMCNHADYKRIAVDVHHYEALDHATGPAPKKYAMVIVDEAHRFRNAWEKESKRMLSWMARIHQSPRVVYLSGTPIVHDAVVESLAFQEMMGGEDFRGRISYYDPRADEKKAHFYAAIEDRVVGCPMTWAQCFVYMQSRKQTFTLHLDDEEVPRTRLTSQRNTYNTLLRSICNCPFPDAPEHSPKFEHMLHWMYEEEAEDKKQVVYSSRKDTGVLALMGLWRGRSRLPRQIFKIDGSMSKDDRADQIVRYNRSLKASVLFITDAAAQGVDLKRVHVVHVMEPADNLQEERQIVNRAVRFKAHREKSAVVRVYRYVMSFPTHGGVDGRWKPAVSASGLFDASELKGRTRSIQKALLRLVAEEDAGMTIDQRTIQRREERQRDVDEALCRLRSASIESCAADCVDNKRRPVAGDGVGDEKGEQPAAREEEEGSRRKPHGWPRKEDADSE